MAFRIGDKVLPTDDLLIKLPTLNKELKDGGVIFRIDGTQAMIAFYSGHKCFLYLTSIRPALIKGQQLLFEFMGH